MLVATSGGRPGLALAAALTVSQTSSALAHGFAGARFFPATIVIDDPFVADEMSLPTVSNQKTGTDPSVVQTDISAEFSKRITSDFAFRSARHGAISTRLDHHTIRTVSKTSKSPPNTSSC
jgi:hypothetical protein